MNKGNYREKYESLLNKFTGNNELLELIEECILDEIGKAEAYYMNMGRYPAERNLLMKLKTDLILMKVKRSD